MIKLVLISALLFFTQNIKAQADADKDDFEEAFAFTAQFEENLQRFKQKPLVDLTEEEQKSVEEFSLNRKISDKYVEHFEKMYQKKYSEFQFLDPWLAVYYDPEYFMEYLEKIPARTLAHKYQLLVLWQVYKPEKINSEEYQQIALQAHNKTVEYLSDKGNWQASWRIDEYNDIIQDNFQKCYADINCLLKAIPYWMDLRIPMNVILPCDLAKTHDLIYYIDVAASASGTRVMKTSSCVVDEKYNFPSELDDYINNINFEKMPYSSGSIMHVYYTMAENQYLDIKYKPDFTAEKINDWRDFPYTQWAVQSYYNFKKFNSVINYGIGYKKAVEMLQNHYIKVYNVDPQKALNAALIALNPPSSNHFNRILPDNINYLLLSGKDWNEISKHLPQDTSPSSLLELSIAYPQNLRHLIDADNQKNVDFKNDFGKTPLQTAAQYGHLESVKILLENGADINHQTDFSQCWSQRDIECQFNSKRTALMYAIQEGNFDVAHYLIDNGADITISDSQGNIALDYLTKLAPKYSTHKLMTIYGGASFHKTQEDIKDFPSEQYNPLRDKLFCNKHTQIANSLIGQWVSEDSKDVQEKAFGNSIVFTKYSNNDEILLSMKTTNERDTLCAPTKKSKDVFLCNVPTILENNGIPQTYIIQFYLSFMIEHYYYDILKIYGVEKNTFDQCNGEDECMPYVIAVFSRELPEDI